MGQQHEEGHRVNHESGKDIWEMQLELHLIGPVRGSPAETGGHSANRRICFFVDMHEIFSEVYTQKWTVGYKYFPFTKYVCMTLSNNDDIIPMALHKSFHFPHICTKR